MEEQPVILKEEPKKKKSALRIIIEWVIYLAILVGLVWGTPKILAKVLNTQYPIATVTSGSMWPALKQGDLIFVKGVLGKNDIKVGDIVIYKNERGFTIHRLVRMNENTFVTKGDANNVEDAAAGYDKLVGKTLMLGKNPLRIPYLGKISTLIR